MIKKNYLYGLQEFMETHHIESQALKKISSPELSLQEIVDCLGMKSMFAL